MQGSSTATRTMPVAGQHPQHQPEALGEPGARRRCCRRRRPRRGPAAGTRRRPRAAVRRRGSRRSRRRRSGRPAPASPSAHSQSRIGNPPRSGIPYLKSTSSRRRGRRGSARRRVAAIARRRPASPTRSGWQVALGLELGVAVDDQPPRHAELAGQLARRRQPLADAEPAGADGVAELGLELGAERLGRSCGPVRRAGPGPNRSTRWPRKWTLPVDRSPSYRGHQQHAPAAPRARPRHDEPPDHRATDRAAPDHGDRRRPPPPPRHDRPRGADSGRHRHPRARRARRSARGPPPWPTPSPSTASTGLEGPVADVCASACRRGVEATCVGILADHAQPPVARERALGHVLMTLVAGPPPRPRPRPTSPDPRRPGGQSVGTGRGTPGRG